MRNAAGTIQTGTTERPLPGADGLEVDFCIMILHQQGSGGCADRGSERPFQSVSLETGTAEKDALLLVFNLPFSALTRLYMKMTGGVNSHDVWVLGPGGCNVANCSLGNVVDLRVFLAEFSSSCLELKRTLIRMLFFKKSRKLLRF